jgi:hypothetical protein
LGRCGLLPDSYPVTAQVPSTKKRPAAVAWTNTSLPNGSEVGVAEHVEALHRKTADTLERLDSYTQRFPDAADGLATDPGHCAVLGPPTGMICTVGALPRANPNEMLPPLI